MSGEQHPQQKLSKWHLQQLRRDNGLAAVGARLVALKVLRLHRAIRGHALLCSALGAEATLARGRPTDGATPGALAALLRGAEDRPIHLVLGSLLHQARAGLNGLLGNRLRIRPNEGHVLHVGPLLHERMAVVAVVDLATAATLTMPRFARGSVGAALVATMGPRLHLVELLRPGFQQVHRRCLHVATHPVLHRHDHATHGVQLAPQVGGLVERALDLVDQLGLRLGHNRGAVVVGVPRLVVPGRLQDPPMREGLLLGDQHWSAMEQLAVGSHVIAQLVQLPLVNGDVFPQRIQTILLHAQHLLHLLLARRDALHARPAARRLSLRILLLRRVGLQQGLGTDLGQRRQGLVLLGRGKRREPSGVVLVPIDVSSIDTRHALNVVQLVVGRVDVFLVVELPPLQQRDVLVQVHDPGIDFVLPGQGQVLCVAGLVRSLDGNAPVL
mmetsp:Transcript_30/g.171  ORF Transcript_30/g.171 Transcript_30/m.171 type:complete len:442 (+) Transcript_30:38-1363(+)